MRSGSSGVVKFEMRPDGKPALATEPMEKVFAFEP